MRGATIVGCVLLTGCAALLSIDGDYVVGADASTDAAKPDGAKSDASVGPPGFCDLWKADASEVFCDDFDEATVVGAGWSGTDIPPEASIAFDREAGATGPPSVAMTTQPAGAFVSLTRSVTTPAQERIAVQASIRVDDYAKGSIDETFSILSVTVTSPDAEFTAFLYVGPQGARLSESRTPADGGARTDKDYSLAQFFIANVWTLARIEIDLVAQTVTVRFDGKQVAQRPVSFPWPKGQVARIAVGSEWAATGSDGGYLTVGVRRFHVDDAILEVK